jgi:AcrR family transcriptional regulator
MTATETAPRSARAEARRDELLTHVMAFVRTDGPFVTMDDLAGACGVTKPILYRHCGDRDGLVAAMADRFVGELVDAVAAGLARKGDPRDRLAVAVRGSLELLGRDPRLYRFLSTQAGTEKRDLLVGLVAESLAAAVESEYREAGRPTDHVRLWSYALVGMVHTAGDWWVDTLDSPDALPVDEVVDSLLSLLNTERLLP